MIFSFRWIVFFPDLPFNAPAQRNPESEGETDKNDGKHGDGMAVHRGPPVSADRI